MDENAARRAVDRELRRDPDADLWTLAGKYGIAVEVVDGIHQELAELGQIGAPARPQHRRREPRTYQGKVACRPRARGAGKGRTGPPHPWIRVRA